MKDFHIQLCFDISKSKFYKKAIQIASNCLDFRPAKEDTQNIIVITEKTVENDYLYIQKLWDIIRTWKNVHLSVNGEIATKEIFIPLQCYALYKKSLIQELHCLNGKYEVGWSCKQLISVVRNLRFYGHTNFVAWYQVGHFKDNIWQVDKEKIAEILKREVCLKCFYLCPLFSFEKVQIHIDNLPNVINPLENKLWKFHYVQELGFPPQLVGVKPKEEESFFTKYLGINSIEPEINDLDQEDKG